MRRGLRSTCLLLGAIAVAAAALLWSRVIPVPGPHPESAPLRAAVTLPLPAPALSPPPAQPSPSPQAAPSVAAVPTAPSAAPTAPVPPPEPFVVDRRAIARAQFYLEQLGYQIGAADGVMGKRTKTAIAAFRAANALPKGEEVDGALIDALDRSHRQLPAKPAEGVPAAAPRLPVVAAPLSNVSR